MSEWQPVETAPQDGFFLVYEDGAMRTMQRDNGVWSHSAIAVRRDTYGDEHLIDGAIIRDVIREPTHWMPLPEPAKPPDPVLMYSGSRVIDLTDTKPALPAPDPAVLDGTIGALVRNRLAAALSCFRCRPF